VLRQPIDDVLHAGTNILLAGCGGGYDVLGAVPLLIELTEAGKSVHLASLSFTALDHVAGHEPVEGVPHLFTTSLAATTEEQYCPEAWLAAWMTSRFERDERIWCFENVGVVPLRRAYEHVVKANGIDTIVLIDGGVDSLLRGDESSLGTPVEDFASLAAVDALDVPRKILACVGFGAELRDGISHAQVLDRVAQMASLGGWLGMWTLLAGMEACKAYHDAAYFIAEHQKNQRGSHIHSVVLESIAGKFGAHGPHVWLSPLASLFWFFSLADVARTNLLLPHIQNCESLWDIAAVIEAMRKTIRVRTPSAIPL
jgi:hypothetical protein